MVVMDSSVIDRAQLWTQQDPNKVTRAYVEQLLSKVVVNVKSTNGNTNDDENENEHATAAAAAAELTRLFPPDNRRIEFGTAGLRSSMSPGPLGMNDLVIIQTAQGIARYCQQQQQEGQGDDVNNNNNNNNTEKERQLRVVIGYDHRANPSLQLSSLLFALYSVLVFEASGTTMEAILLDGYVHTPLVAFATKALSCTVGIMITASHNPKYDAGYKVYWNDGCQIRPPVDAGIRSCIMDNLDPWIDYGSLLSTLQKEGMDTCLGLSNPQVTREMTAAYFGAIARSGLVTGQAASLLLKEQGEGSNQQPPPPPRFAYTAMHGVGREVAVKVFEVFGLPQFCSVPQQELPDPTFATVVFPNPEERGALDVAKDFAVQRQCDIVFANDPDADRLAVAERDRQTGQWTVFTGDQIGTMLGHWLWEQVGKKDDKPVAMCASTVSSKMLAEIARVEGFHFEETLTGFKWIGSRAESLSREGYRSLFCYEEAIGFCCGDVVYDKDGISALGVFAELSYNVYHRGLSLVQHMQSLYDKYGEFVSNNGYYFCYDPAVVTRILHDMQNNGNYMETVGPYAVESIRDLSTPGYDSTTKDKRPTLPTSSSSPMMTIRFANNCVAQFRASGTEPKFKYYIEMKGEPGVSRDVVTGELHAMCDVILEELLHPNANGLVAPSS